MRWSWRIGTLTGIEVRIHVTFLLLLLWIGAKRWMLGQSLAAALAGVGFIAALFGCVVLHELGHALMARLFGIATRDITLLPIGGVARLERMPDEPAHELWVALAGPAVNAVIAAMLFECLVFLHVWSPPEELTVAGGPFLERLTMANLWLVLFNLIPAFPMDGGRILRASLASRMPHVKATQIAAGVGQGLAVVLGFIGLFGNPLLLFIALFVWMGASQEAASSQMKAAMAGTPVHAAMLTDFYRLGRSDTLAEAVYLIVRGSQQDFPVVEQDQVIGILTRADLLVALAERGKTYPVTSTMRREFLTSEPAEMLEVAFRRLVDCRCHTMPVVREGRLVGLLTMDNVGEYLMVQAAIRKSGRLSGMAAGLKPKAA